jgi:hypothetical protein
MSVVVGRPENMCSILRFDPQRAFKCSVPTR